MLMGRIALKLFTYLSGALLITAIGAPAFTYFAWQRAHFLHKMQAEGVDATAKITDAWLLRREGSPAIKSITFNIVWTDKQGVEHKKHDVSPSLAYGKQFMTLTGSAPQNSLFAQYALTTKEAPLRYLASDPEQFILSADPGFGAGGVDQILPWSAEQMLPWGVAASILALANAVLFYKLRSIYMRGLALADANPGGVEERTEIQTTWILITLVGYGILAGIHFFPDTHAFNVKAFGATPFGLPVTAVVIAAGTIVYLPFIWVNWHLARLFRQASKDGVAGRYGVLFYVFTSGGPAHLRNSHKAVWVGALYAFALGAAWITYTGRRGI
jgi:hypothetical protein